MSEERKESGREARKKALEGERRREGNIDRQK